MDIQRTILEDLSKWGKAEKRKPLILQGTRQVGKTWILQQFGQRKFDDVAYFNFDERPQLKQFFETTKDVERILLNLSTVHGKRIEPEKTLIIFDEIQECKEALNALKYFCEKAPQYAVTAAGSLLGVAVKHQGASFPVGKVDFLHLYPLSFSEFLSVADAGMYNYLQTFDFKTAIPDLFFDQLTEKFKLFLISGGMPEAAATLLSTQDLALVGKTLKAVSNAYALDFSKYAEAKDIPKIGLIWHSVPTQLAKENKKFVYQFIKSGARARDYENALLWLANAGLVYRVFKNEKPALPLSAYDDFSAFKLYSLDVGLLRNMANLDPLAVVEGNRLFTEFKGSLAENFILQSLIAQYETIPRYWTSGNMAEIDFIIQHKNEIIPIEVKSGENTKSKSLGVYEEKYHPTLRIRFSQKNLHRAGNLLNIPLFLVDYTKRIIDMNK